MNDDLSEFLESPKPGQCPCCGSSRVAWIVFGLPTDETIEDAQEDGDMVFGSCCLDLDAPPFYCKGCSFEWGAEERQSRQERETQLSNEQKTELMRLSFRRSLQEHADRDKRRKERVIQYYRDRHARRLHPQSIALQVFTVGYQGQVYPVGLNERGQLMFPARLQLKSACAIEATADEEGFRTTLLHWWQENPHELPDAMGETQHLLRQRGEARRRYKRFRDPLTRPQSLRIAQDVSRACHLATEALKKCAYSFIRNKAVTSWVEINVTSRTKHDIQLSVEIRPRHRGGEEENQEDSSRQITRLEVSIAKARRWLHRVHYRGLSILDGHFVFEVSEIITPDKLKVLAAQETPIAQLCLEPALAQRDAKGNWHLQWLSQD